MFDQTGKCVEWHVVILKEVLGMMADPEASARRLLGKC